MLLSGGKLGCVRCGIDGSGEIRRPTEHSGEGAAPADDQSRQEFSPGRSSVQAITRARILLKTDEGWSASKVAAALDISERTVFRAKRRYALEGLDEVLRRRN